MVFALKYGHFNWGEMKSKWTKRNMRARRGGMEKDKRRKK
jgi:hypothetical protein